MKALDKKTALAKSIRRNDKKNLRDFDKGKTNVFESHAAKIAQAGLDKKWASYIKERSARYKREGITE